jgi:hypothetical protein
MTAETERRVPLYAESFGYSLAMRVMQSDLYPHLAPDERAECDELIARGQGRASIAVPPESGQHAITLLRSVLGIVQRYLPPDGPTVDEAMSEIIALVDPWPLDVSWEILPEPPAPTAAPPEFDRDNDGELLIDWSPSQGRMVTLTLRADGRLSYAFVWDGEKAHGHAQMPVTAAPEAPTMDKGPWSVMEHNGKVFAESDDFDHDVCLQINGDFADNEERKAYAAWLCGKLNAPASPERVALPEQPTGDEYHAANRCVDAAVLHLTGSTKWPDSWRPLREQFLGFIRAVRPAAGGEAVAYRRVVYRTSGAPYWSYTETRISDADEPLYTHPTAQAGDATNAAPGVGEVRHG